MNPRSFVDYISISNHYTNPSFLNIIRPKKSLTSQLFNVASINNINKFINGAQKAVEIYNKAIPIIEQTKPFIDNIKTTFKVARAFKKITKEDSLENLFDKLPDFDDDSKTNGYNKEVANPFYPWYN